MESMVMNSFFGGIYKGKTVLVTGHTGFKGSWLCLWLSKLGANIVGYSTDSPTCPNHFSLLNLKMTSIIGDVRDYYKLESTIKTYKADIVFHLAAQSLVRPSYSDPVETYSVNIMGTVNLFDICRKQKSVKAVINVTSDKCYENKEWHWGYRENEPMGGHDPYSASKGCSELVTSSYRKSFGDNLLIASARAGNVIGGGDWAEDRLIPDIMKATSQDTHVTIRNPYSTRPWQHVLEPLSGYLLLGKRLLQGKVEFADAWNFGPDFEGTVSVEKIIAEISRYWKVKVINPKNSEEFHEASQLKLDCSKSKNILRWTPVWNIHKTVEFTVKWYKAFYTRSEILSEVQLEKFLIEAKQKEKLWTLE